MLWVKIAAMIARYPTVCINGVPNKINKIERGRERERERERETTEPFLLAVTVSFPTSA